MSLARYCRVLTGFEHTGFEWHFRVTRGLGLPDLTRSALCDSITVNSGEEPRTSQLALRFWVTSRVSA